MASSLPGTVQEGPAALASSQASGPKANSSPRRTQTPRASYRPGPGQIFSGVSFWPTPCSARAPDARAACASSGPCSTRPRSKRSVPPSPIKTVPPRTGNAAAPPPTPAPRQACAETRPPDPPTHSPPTRRIHRARRPHSLARQSKRRRSPAQRTPRRRARALASPLAMIRHCALRQLARPETPLTRSRATSHTCPAAFVFPRRDYVTSSTLARAPPCVRILAHTPSLRIGAPPRRRVQKSGTVRQGLRRAGLSANGLPACGQGVPTSRLARFPVER